MRLISQDGMIDVPYEQVAIELKESEVWCEYSATVQSYCTGRMMAKYTTEAKALKVMEMLRNAYVGMPVIMQNVEIADEVIEKLKKQNVIYAKFPEEKSSIEYVNNAIFQFPKDEEVEV